jgi:hypothetical protein
MAGMFASLGGVRVVTLDLLLKYYGAPVGIVTTDLPVPISGPTRLVVADLTLAVAAYRTQAFAARQPFFIVGGFGGWRQPVPSQAYAFPGSNVTSQQVLADIAGIVGETVNVTAPVNFGPYFFREAGPASRLLKLLAGSTWWIDSSGTTQVGPRTNVAAISTPFELIDFDGAQGKATIATENPSDWQPGRTFTTPVLAAVKTVTSTSMTFGASGALRLEVLTA